MAKLNKQEVNAIASKLHRELEKSVKESRERAIVNYTPSEKYTAVKDLLAQRDEIEQQISELKKKRASLVSQVENILRESYDIWYYADNKSVEEICDKMVYYECKLKSIPSVDELKEDVTIAAIDDSFDTASFIEEQLAKFK